MFCSLLSPPYGSLTLQFTIPTREESIWQHNPRMATLYNWYRRKVYYTIRTRGKYVMAIYEVRCCCCVDGSIQKTSLQLTRPYMNHLLYILSYEPYKSHLLYILSQVQSCFHFIWAIQVPFTLHIIIWAIQVSSCFHFIWAIHEPSYFTYYHMSHTRVIYFTYYHKCHLVSISYDPYIILHRAHSFLVP